MMLAYDVFRADMAERPPLHRAAMFLELTRGNVTLMEKLPREAPLPKVRQPTNGQPWWIESEDRSSQQH
jgi:hypothetical protein